MASMPDASRKPATFLMTSSTAPGHFLRVLDLAQQLTSRGHRVLFKTKATVAAQVKAAGAEHRLSTLGEARTRLGLPPHAGRTADLIQASISPRLHIVMAHRSLAGDVPLRDNQLFVGPTTFNASAKTREEAPRVEPGTVVISTTTTG